MRTPNGWSNHQRNRWRRSRALTLSRDGELLETVYFMSLGFAARSSLALCMSSMPPSMVHRATDSSAARKARSCETGDAALSEVQGHTARQGRKTRSVDWCPGSFVSCQGARVHPSRVEPVEPDTRTASETVRESSEPCTGFRRRLRRRGVSRTRARRAHSATNASISTGGGSALTRFTFGSIVATPAVVPHHNHPGALKQRIS